MGTGYWYVACMMGMVAFFHPYGQTDGQAEGVCLCVMSARYDRDYIYEVYSVRVWWGWMSVVGQQDSAWR